MNKKFLCHFRSEGGSLTCGLAGWISLFERVHSLFREKKMKNKNVINSTANIYSICISVFMADFVYDIYIFIKYKLKEVQQQLPKHSHGHSFFGDACIVPILSSFRCCCCTSPTREHRMNAHARALAFSDVFAYRKNFSASFLSLIFACKNESQVIIS